MQTSDLFRWLYTTTGLWLILSPFLIFSRFALSQGVVTNEAVTLMVFGLLALVILSRVSAARGTVQFKLPLAAFSETD
ncbi:hypothetical protein RUE5091_00263 [Ruegeria denitrificans]|uniref:Uncharacterized protein n=1 Tax=Ruegeria denitrificans TaxID=1715692 RepID=A0A0P1I1N5_9RHOB|nr:hypothetical protein RUE5091_00263 [Ruegeria denitrificans]